jgi:hypothetical protein
VTAVNRDDRLMWNAATGLGELANLSARWWADAPGAPSTHPLFFNADDPRPELGPRLCRLLAHLCQRGLLVTAAQHGHDTTARRRRWSSLATVTGYTTDDGCRWYARAVAGAHAELAYFALRCKGRFDFPHQGIVTTVCDGEPVTRHGYQLSEVDIWRDWGEWCSDPVIAALVRAWQFTAHDTRADRDDLLWTTLATAASAADAGREAANAPV